MQLGSIRFVHHVVHAHEAAGIVMQRPEHEQTELVTLVCCLAHIKDEELECQDGMAALLFLGPVNQDCPF